MSASEESARDLAEIEVDLQAEGVKTENENEKEKEMERVREIARLLLQATALPGTLGYTAVDYYRIASQAVFRCHRCGTCCTTADPIKLRGKDVAKIARHLKMSLQRAKRKLVVRLGDDYAFKRARPCRFYDARSGCKIYAVRPWSCRIFPLLGIYGSPERVVVHPTCPGSVEAARKLHSALEELKGGMGAIDPAAVRRARNELEEMLKEMV